MVTISKTGARLKTAVQVSKLMLEQAIQATAEGLSQHAAAKLFDVPRSTMRDRMENPDPKPKGGQLKLPEWAEKELADLFVSCADAGVPLNRYHALQVMSELAAELGKYETNFRKIILRDLLLMVIGMENMSFGDKFFRRFVSKYKILSVRFTHATNRKKDREWTEEKCEEYISKLQELKDQGFLERLEQAWNLDETAFDTTRMVDRVLARGAKQIVS
ncbi:hypothetical protein RvY_07184 [Ramazzottius varieornatus]|uniref:HTH psq-type domain-containing protein n=1 Tax=Ramazzottius varieornatus TaxID=947166 RepID=A0A1D1V7D2_RAMVA|nr:hypothetical protein RvY_07184 [Ramazzottius varieornatus]